MQNYSHYRVEEHSRLENVKSLIHFIYLSRATMMLHFFSAPARVNQMEFVTIAVIHQLFKSTPIAGIMFGNLYVGARGGSYESKVAYTNSG